MSHVLVESPKPTNGCSDHPKPPPVWHMVCDHKGCTASIAGTGDTKVKQKRSATFAAEAAGWQTYALDLCPAHKDPSLLPPLKRLYNDDGTPLAQKGKRRDP